MTEQEILDEIIRQYSCPQCGAPPQLFRHLDGDRITVICSEGHEWISTGEE